MASTARMDQLDRPEAQGLLVQLELQELQELREPQGQQAALEPRGPLVPLARLDLTD